MQPKLTMHQLIGAMVRVVLTVQSVTRCACDRAGPRRPSWLSSSLVPHRSQPRMRIRVYTLLIVATWVRRVGTGMGPTEVRTTCNLRLLSLARGSLI